MQVLFFPIREGNAKILLPFFSILCFCVLWVSGCASDAPAKRFTEILHRYPQTQEPLKIQKLSGATMNTVARLSKGTDVSIIVHPAYSLFFRESKRSTYTEAKYDLLKHQLDNEERFISELSKSGKPLILVLPGNYATESVAPLSYTYYLNSTTEANPSVFYVFSETADNGTLPTDTVVTLYSFLQAIRANRVMIGGGYIGRCQREFYNQLTTYVDKITTYIVPEMSSISPDDISSKDAAEILNSLRMKDYTPVRKFIERKTAGNANILSIPQKLDR